MQEAHHKSRNRLIGMIFVIVIACLLYRWLVLNKLEQTSALFIGIPALLAIGLSFLPPSKTLTGTILKGTLIALMVAGICLQEGFVCIAMATPLFALIAIVVGKFIEKMRSKKSSRTLSVLVLLPLAMEGVFPAFEFSRHETVHTTQEFAMTETELLQRLAQPVAVRPDFPLFLQLGFPTATQIRGEGLEPGKSRCIYFSGGEGSPGDLCLKVLSVAPQKVVFAMTKDDSHIAHWLTWKTATVSWAPTTRGTLAVRWQMDYDRELDPYWYFAPLERYGVRLAADHLLTSYFRPGASPQ